MSEIKKNKITFAWWNTSLSPHSKKNKSSQKHKDFVLYTILRLIDAKNADVLCLCETSQEDILYIMNKIQELSSEFSFLDGTFSEGRKKFDICVIYRHDKLTFIDSDIISSSPLKGKLYAGLEVNFFINATAEPLTLYLVHWPSRMYDYEGSPQKINLGALLRTAVNNCMDIRNVKNVVIIGDFNEEPFDKSLTDGLFASRDIAQVKKEPKLLYNPFWRHMVHSNLHPNHDSSLEGCGTYYYRGDGVNPWKTFDQMIFSSDFISGKSWFLDESKIEVFSDELFISFICNSKSRFDHLPIISVIEGH